MWHKIPSDQHVLKASTAAAKYSTVKVCNLVFLCMGSNMYCYIHLANIAFLLEAETYNRLFFSFWG